MHCIEFELLWYRYIPSPNQVKVKLGSPFCAQAFETHRTGIDPTGQSASLQHSMSSMPTTQFRRMHWPSSHVNLSTSTQSVSWLHSGTGGGVGATCTELGTPEATLPRPSNNSLQYTASSKFSSGTSLSCNRADDEDPTETPKIKRMRKAWMDVDDFILLTKLPSVTNSYPNDNNLTTDSKL